MSDPDPAVEYWKNRYRDLSEAELEMKKVRSYPHLPEWKAANALLIEMKNGRDERRHQDQLAESRVSRRWDKVAIVIAIVGIAGGVAAWRWPSLDTKEPAIPPPSFSEPADHADPIPGSAAILATPPTDPPPLPAATPPDETLKPPTE